MYYYHEYTPDIRLTPWVKNYWTANGFVSSEVIPKVFPDGCTDIIFTFGGTKGISYAGLFGTMTTFVEVDYPKSTQMFGIRFKPAGITAFTRVPMEELTDRSVDLSLIETLFEKSFYETLPEKQSVAEIVILFLPSSLIVTLDPCFKVTELSAEPAPETAIVEPPVTALEPIATAIELAVAISLAAILKLRGISALAVVLLFFILVSV